MGSRFSKAKKNSEALPAQAEYSSARSQALKKEERKAEKFNFVWKGGGAIQDRYLMEGQLEKGVLSEEKCEAYLENRNMNSPEKHNKTSGPASIESANVKDSISLTINEKGVESIKDPEKAKTENEISLHNLISAAIEALRTKTAEILSRPNNQELEMDFRATCAAYQTNSILYDPSVMQAYHDYLNAYQKKTSLYNILRKYYYNSTVLEIYNTETETCESKTLLTPQSLDSCTCITQLPNGKLFCYGNENYSGVTLLIDVNGEVEVLPSGQHCRGSSCIYFNNSVYCFGGMKAYKSYLTLSSRFDLDQNRWIQLTPMPEEDLYCNQIIFNRNILISPWGKRNLWLYSIDIDSFSSIPYEFSGRAPKILINAERLYLIESDKNFIHKTCIYESDIGSYTNWRQISELQSKIIGYSQVYCLYNKGGIYISGNIHEPCMQPSIQFKLDLNKKLISDLKYKGIY